MSKPTSCASGTDLSCAKSGKNEIVETFDGRGFTSVTIYGTTWTKSYFDLREALGEAVVLGLLTRMQTLQWLYRRDDTLWPIEPGVHLDPRKLKQAGFMGEPAQSGIIFARGDEAAVLIELNYKPWLREFRSHHAAADTVCSMGLISKVEAIFASRHLVGWCPGFYDFPLSGKLTPVDLVEHGFRNRA